MCQCLPFSLLILANKKVTVGIILQIQCLLTQHFFPAFQLAWFIPIHIYKSIFSFETLWALTHCYNFSNCYVFDLRIIVIYEPVKVVCNAPHMCHCTIWKNWGIKMIHALSLSVFQTVARFMSLEIVCGKWMHGRGFKASFMTTSRKLSQTVNKSIKNRRLYYYRSLYYYQRLYYYRSLKLECYLTNFNA